MKALSGNVLNSVFNMRNIYVLGFATFGHPNDFRQSFFLYGEDKAFAQKIKAFDLTNAIKVFPNATVYSIRKDYVNETRSISYSIYTYAKEKDSTREGTFIGSSIVYANKIAEESITFQKLNDFHAELVGRNLEDSTLIVNHSDHFSVSKELKSNFESLNFNFKEIEGIDSYYHTNNNLVVYTRIDQSTLVTTLKKAVELLNKYDTVFFTDNKDVSNYSRQRKLYSVVDEQGFEDEIQIIHEEKAKKLQSTIIDLENEKRRLEAEKIKVVQDYKNQLDQNEKLHQNNLKTIEESKVRLIQLHEKYDDYGKKLDELVDELKLTQNYYSVSRLQSDEKKLFSKALDQLLSPVYINTVSNPSYRIEEKSIHGYTQADNREYTSSNTKQKKDRKQKLDIFKILTLMLFLLWVGTLTYFLYFHTKQISIADTKTQENIINTAELPVTDTVATELDLTPAPNSELDKKDYRIVAAKLRNGLTVQEVVKIIFDTNPTDIKSNYSQQIEAYSKKLIHLNENYFQEAGENYFFNGDTLKHIPAFKKDK